MMRLRTAADLDKDAADEAAAAERIGTLCGLDDTTVPMTPPPDQVGWMQLDPQTVKGTNHRCLPCCPTKPGKGHWEAVTRVRLAATMPCYICGTVLEKVVLHEPAQKVKPGAPK